MRATLLLTAVVLAFAAAPAQTSTLQAPTGTYGGTSQHHGVIYFTLSHDRRHVTNFRASGHVLMHSAAFHHSEHSIGHFEQTANGVHVWGHWSHEHFPVATGGYSYDNGSGTHVVSHWSARVP
jgi:hypothetical protein